MRSRRWRKLGQDNRTVPWHVEKEACPGLRSVNKIIPAELWTHAFLSRDPSCGHVTLFTFVLNECWLVSCLVIWWSANFVGEIRLSLKYTWCEIKKEHDLPWYFQLLCSMKSLSLDLVKQPMQILTETGNSHQ